MYRDNTPTFNAGNRNLVNYKGFKPEEEYKELRDIQKSQIKKNDPNVQSQEHRRKNRWNKVTHKIEDLHPLEVDDKVEELEEMQEVLSFRKFNEEYLDPMGDWKPSDDKEDFLKLAEDYLNSGDAFTVHALGIRDFAKWLNNKLK
jgi:hypothetical protein